LSWGTAAERLPCSVHLFSRPAIESKAGPGPELAGVRPKRMQVLMRFGFVLPGGLGLGLITTT